MFRSRKEDERGLFVIWTLGLGLALLAIGILVVDFWHIFAVRRDLHDIADGAAVVGSQQIDTEYFKANRKVILKSEGEVTYMVCTYLAKNSPDANCDDSSHAQVRLIPDAAGDNIGVTVDLSQDVDFMALRFLPSKNGDFKRSETVEASASARAQQLDP